MLKRRSNILATWCEELPHWKRPKGLKPKAEGAAGDEMVRQHHWLNGHECEQAPGDSRGQRSPACYSPWGLGVGDDRSDWTTTKITKWKPSKGFPGGSRGTESACNAGEEGLIPRLSDPLEKGMATHSSILAWRSPWTVEPGSYSPWGHKELDKTEWLSLAHSPKINFTNPHTYTQKPWQKPSMHFSYISKT